MGFERKNKSAYEYKLSLGPTVLTYNFLLSDFLYLAGESAISFLFFWSEAPFLFLNYQDIGHWWMPDNKMPFAAAKSSERHSVLQNERIKQEATTPPSPSSVVPIFPVLLLPGEYAGGHPYRVFSA